MSKVLISVEEKDARVSLLNLLKQCTISQQEFFKRIFSHKQPNISIEDVVVIVPLDKINSAIQLCERTINKINPCHQKQQTDAEIIKA